jgi:hypothetical protein
VYLQKSTSTGFYWLFVLIVLYLGWYFYYLTLYAVDVPYIDDYDALLQYILTYKDVDTWEKFKSLFLPHSEHIIVMTRLAAWVSYTLTGHISIRGMILTGNALLVLQLGLLYMFFRPSLRFSVIYFLLVVLIFINPQYSPTSFWAMAVWTNTWVFVPVTLCLFTLVNPKHLKWAVPLAVCAHFSNGSGIMIWPVGVFILWMTGRPLRHYLIWTAIGGLSCLGYFYLMSQQPKAGTFIISNLGMFPLNCLAFIGAYAALLGGLPGQIMAVVLGSIVVGVGFLMLRNYQKTREQTELMLISLLLFILLAAVSVALFRAEKGMSIIIGGRYRHYSSLAVAVFVLIGFRLFTFRVSRWLAVVPWVVILLITGLSYFRDIGLRLTTEWRTVADYYNFLHNQADVYTTDGTPRFWKTTLKAHESGLYVVPLRYDLNQQLQKAARLTFKSTLRLERNQEEKVDSIVCGNYWLLTEPQLQFPDSPKDAFYAVLSQGSHRYIFPTSSTRNPWSVMVKQRRYFKKGLASEVYDCFVPLANAQIEWLQTGHQPKLFQTNTIINVNP